MANQYQVLSLVSMVLFGFGMAGVIVIVWIGWLRTRQLGYLVLAAWALTTAAGMATSYLPALQSFFGKPMNQDAMLKMMMWTNLVRTLVSSALLVFGLGLLVFAQRRDVSPPRA